MSGELGAMAIRPRVEGIVEGLVVAAIVWAATTAAAKYQDGLKAEAKANVHLDPLGSAFVALPPAIFVAIAALLVFAIALAAVFVIQRYASSKPAATPVAQNTDEVNDLKRKINAQVDEVYQSTRARDEARAELDALKREMQQVAAQRDTLQSEWRAVQRQLADTPSLAVFESVLNERDALRNEVEELRAGAREPDLTAIAINKMHEMKVQEVTQQRDDALKALADERDRKPPETLRHAAFQLAKEIRVTSAAVPSNLTLDQEFEILYDDFHERYWNRYNHIKDRLKVALPAFKVASVAEWTAGTKDNLRKIAENLDREAMQVPEDFLL